MATDVPTSHTRFLVNLAEVLEYANAFVLPLLRRRERIEDIGKVLELLQRYRFLFTLPHMITQNIEKVCCPVPSAIMFQNHKYLYFNITLQERYDDIVADYHKALSLYGDVEIFIFSRVMDEACRISRG